MPRWAMTDAHQVQFTGGTPRTVLDPLPGDVAAALESALDAPRDERSRAVSDVARRWPRCLEAWASLAELTDDEVEQYAFARVGYHRGLDALRAAGWRGSGFVRWSDEPNRGFLRSVDALRRAAAAIAERDEEARCDQFLHQLDPDWDRQGARTS